MDTPIERLHAALLTLSGDRKNFPRTRKLLESGKTRIAQKLGEEAVETVIEGVRGKKRELAAESADLLYHLLVLWADRDLKPAEVWQQLAEREGLSGVEEKKSRKS